ncbi:MAG: peptidoglycan DD-metalloendopeptidase family protein [Candidatus Sedimenticola sp. (ex Thyasira tokunagai)]
MINDYRSQSELGGINSSRSHHRLGLIVLATTILCASAIYASIQIMSGGTTAQIDSNVISTAQQLEAKSGAADTQTVTLQLPIPNINGTSQPFPSKLEVRATETTVTPLQQKRAHEVASPIPQTKTMTAESTPTAPPAADPGKWFIEKVKSGDSLAKIFNRLNLSPNLLHRIVHSGKKAKELANIKPGETLRVRLDGQGGLLELVHQRSPVLSLHILPKDDSFISRVDERALEKRVTHTSGSISNSLYQSAQEAGLSDSLIMELANIFGWDIDFALEIRAGDHFSVIYEENYLDGEKYRNGSILAAEFINRGKVFRAIRHEDENGHSNYYSPKGNSMRKAFLRAPVDFRRISSNFTKSRWHPVLGKKRPHRGVDYAAAIGTHIKAAGDGKVIFRGRKGGYGNTVIIKHANQYTTLYAHMSKFRGKVKKGSRVSQGQVIGYVGKTGRTTGPHLHYELRINGVHRNPRTVKLPSSAPIAKKHRADFTRVSRPLLARLDLISSSRMLAETKTQ